LTTATVSGVPQLVALLEAETALYGELLQLGEQERSAVVADDPRWLNALVADKERVLVEVARVEAARQDWMAVWTAAHGLPGETSLADLARRLPAADAARLNVVRKDLLERVRDVAEMNHRNHELLRSALRIVNRSIEAFSRIGGAGYKPNGERAPASRTMVLDRRA